MKQLVLLRNDDKGQVITCDFPLLLMEDQTMRTPWGGTGFLLANVVLPISSKCVLCFINAEAPLHPPASLDEMTRLWVRKLSEESLIDINRRVILNAEDFVFSSQLDKETKRLFDRTTKEPRFKISGLFAPPRNSNRNKK